jgi:hypothetical protein
MTFNSDQCPICGKDAYRDLVLICPICGKVGGAASVDEITIQFLHAYARQRDLEMDLETFGTALPPTQA